MLCTCMYICICMHVCCSKIFSSRLTQPGIPLIWSTVIRVFRDFNIFQSYTWGILFTSQPLHLCYYQSTKFLNVFLYSSCLVKIKISLYHPTFPSSLKPLPYTPMISLFQGLIFFNHVCVFVCTRMHMYIHFCMCIYKNTNTIFPACIMLLVCI